MLNALLFFIPSDLIEFESQISSYIGSGDPYSFHT